MVQIIGIYVRLLVNLVNIDGVGLYIQQIFIIGLLGAARWYYRHLIELYCLVFDDIAGYSHSSHRFLFYIFQVDERVNQVTPILK